jgi:outer membrane protein OmpA-like peptidoglycan-associated protein
MKSNFFNSTIQRATTAALLFAACFAGTQAQQLAGGQVSIHSKQVARQGDKVLVTFDLNMDKLQLKSNKGLVFTPMLANAGDTLKMPSVEIMGHKRYIYYLRNNQSATKNPMTIRQRVNGVDQTINYLYKTDFQKWMERSQLLIAEGTCGCEQTLIADNHLTDAGQWLEPEKPRVQPKPKTKEVKTYNVTGVARLVFPVNKGDIQADMGNNREELAKINKTISQVRNDTTMMITSILIHGYASPDGSYANNERLARLRSQAITDYITKVYNVDPKIVTTTSTAEDWQGVADWLEHNDMPQKAAVQNILAANLSPDEKERAIAAKAGQAHRYLIKNVYPSLRRTEYTVYYVYKREIEK